MEKEHHGNGFMNGLLTGLILGGGIVFLLGTKRGKKLLKAISEEGLEGVSGLGELLEDNLGEDDIMEEQEVESAQIPAEDKSSTVKKIHSSAKRFFKRKR